MAIVAEYNFGACKIKVDNDKFLSPEEQEEKRRNINGILIREAMRQEKERRLGHE